MALRVPPANQSMPDAEVCITDLCQESAPGLPANPALFSYVPNCADASCLPSTGCTAWCAVHGPRLAGPCVVLCSLPGLAAG